MIDPMEFSTSRRHRHVGALLADQRRRVRVDHLAVAQADGSWSTADVAEIESWASVGAADYQRYQLALAAIERWPETPTGDERMSTMTGSNIKIVVLQRGWVVVGKLAEVSETEHELTGASVIRRWGTTKGLGELRTGPTSNTVLDPCGRVTFHPMAVIARLDVEDEAWSSL